LLGWFVLALCLPVISLLLLVAFPERHLRWNIRICPHCAEAVSRYATGCRYCGYGLPIAKGGINAGRAAAVVLVLLLIACGVWIKQQPLEPPAKEVQQVQAQVELEVVQPVPAIQERARVPFLNGQPEEESVPLPRPAPKRRAI
jgi:hypothetical protein